MLPRGPPSPQRWPPPPADRYLHSSNGEWPMSTGGGGATPTGGASARSPSFPATAATAASAVSSSIVPTHSPPGVHRVTRPPQEEGARARGKGKAASSRAVTSAPSSRHVIHGDGRLEGWSIISKITPFVHAVGRVSGGRGSAILVALPEKTENERAVASSNALWLSSQRRRKRRDRFLRNLCRTGSSPPPHGGGSASRGDLSSRGAASEGRDSWSAATAFMAYEDGAGEGTGCGYGTPDALGLSSSSSQAPLAVLLTTSSVLDSREEAAGATVTFMEQPVAGTTAQLGRNPKPFSVAVRSDMGFVCSVAPSKRPKNGAASLRSARGVCGRRGNHSGGPAQAAHGGAHAPCEEWNGGSGGGGAAADNGNNAGDPPYTHCRGSNTIGSDSTDDEDDKDAAEEIGYTLTYCELEPRGGLFADEDHIAWGAHNGNIPSATSFGVSSHSFRAGGGPTSHENDEPSPFLGAAAAAAAAGPGAYPGVSGAGGSARLCGPRTSSSAMAEKVSSVGLKQQKMDSVFLIKPLPLPLLLSAIQRVKVGDTHLMVTHVDAHERHYVVQHVSTVYLDYCEYKDDPMLLGDFSSGGPVFNSSGDFIGLQHRLGNQSICIFSSSIVNNLFHANKLGMCRTPISSQPLPDDGTFGQRVVTTMEHVPEEVFNQPFSFTQQSSATDVGVEGTRLIDFDDLERIRKYRERYVPLTERKPCFSEVYKEFYRGFDSLTHMLNAFYYCPALTAMVLETMVSAKYRKELETVASSGGVGMVLEVMDGYPDMESLVITSLSALSRMCLHTHNLAAFVLLDGVATVLEIMKEYPHSPQILQWGAYCLAHVTKACAPSVQKTVTEMLRCNVVELAVSALRTHGKTQRHMSRWLCAALASTATIEPRAVTLYIQEELPDVVLDLVEHFSHDASTLAGLFALLSVMLQTLMDALPDHFASMEEQQALEELKAFVCTSPLPVSAYFLYVTLASRPAVLTVEAEGTVGEDHLFNENGNCRCPFCPRCSSNLARRASNEDGATGERNSVPTEGEEGASLTGEGALELAEDRDACHCRLSVPRTALNCSLMAMLDCESRERRNNASVELLEVCLDVLTVLDAWGLFPVHYTPGCAEAKPVSSEQAEGSFVGAYGFASSTVQEVLDRIKANFFVSLELTARVDRFACSPEQPM